jgi:hypothetical protein
MGKEGHMTNLSTRESAPRATMKMFSLVVSFFCLLAKEILRRDGLLDESTAEAWKDSGLGYNVPIEEKLYAIRQNIVQFTKDLDAFEEHFIVSDASTAKC